MPTRRPDHTAIRIRAARSWPRPHGEEPPHVPLTGAEKAELARLAQIIDFRTAGSEIFSQDDTADFVYLLVEGVVQTCHMLPDGERQVLAFHWPGDFFGLAEHGRHVSAADTIAPSLVYRFPAEKLEAFLLKHPNVQDKFLVKAIHDLRKAQRQLIVLGRLDIPRRLAVFLVDCSAHDGYFDQGGQILSLPMTRYDIADYLGTSAETVTRAMTRLEELQLLKRVTARDIKLDLPALKSFIALD